MRFGVYGIVNICGIWQLKKKNLKAFFFFSLFILFHGLVRNLGFVIFHSLVWDSNSKYNLLDTILFYPTFRVVLQLNSKPIRLKRKEISELFCKKFHMITKQSCTLLFIWIFWGSIYGSWIRLAREGMFISIYISYYPNLSRPLVLLELSSRN